MADAVIVLLSIQGENYTSSKLKFNYKILTCLCSALSHKATEQSTWKTVQLVNTQKNKDQSSLS